VCVLLTFEAHVGEPFRAPLPMQASQGNGACSACARARGLALWAPLRAALLVRGRAFVLLASGVAGDV
jgi:hypothetical protein